MGVNLLATKFLNQKERELTSRRMVSREYVNQKIMRNIRTVGPLSNYSNYDNYIT